MDPAIAARTEYAREVLTADAILVKTSRDIHCYTGDLEYAPEVARVLERLKYLDVSSDVVASTGILEALKGLIRSDATHKIKVMSMRLIENWLSVHLFPKPQGTNIFETHIHPTIQEQAVAGFIEQMTFWKEQDEAEGRVHTLDQRLLSLTALIGDYTSAKPNGPLVDTLRDPLAYERVIDTLRKDLEAAKLTEHKAASDLTELRKQKSTETRVFESKLRKDNDRQRKDFFEQEEAEVQRQMQQSDTDLSNLLTETEQQLKKYKSSQVDRER